MQKNINFTNIDLNKINYKLIYEKIIDDGFYIFKNFIDLEQYQKSREESIRFFKEYSKTIKNLKSPLRGSVGAGMKDILGYDNNKYWKITRGVYFPWNKINENLFHTINLSRQLSKFRNKICGFNANLGSAIEQDGYVQYTSLSLYDNNGGFLKRHKDGHTKGNKNMCIHFKLELTHKNIDYQKGGFYLWDKNNKEIDISAQIKPTDLILFNGSNFHQIKPIYGKLGRLALFEIPTYVTDDSRLYNYSSGSDSILRKGMNKIKRIFYNFQNID